VTADPQQPRLDPKRHKANEQQESCMTPQTPQGAALSDARLLELMQAADPETKRIPPGLRAIADALVNEGRRLTAEQGGADLRKAARALVNGKAQIAYRPYQETVHVPRQEFEALRAALTTQPQAEPAVWTTKRLNEWVRNHYQDYPNIDAFLVGLGTAMGATPTAPTEPT